jgi:SpoVK/Ycf46/Vps4 family AAA+-type ATPase
MIVDRGGFSVYVNGDPEYVAHGLAVMRRIEPDRPIIVMIEDIDAIVDRHGEASLLALLDGELQIDNVVFIATTNYPEQLDARFVNRPSRFDEIIRIGMPNDKAREVYLRMKNPRLASDAVELQKWIDATDGWSIAHMRELIAAVECLDNNFEDVVKRLMKMNEIKPSSEHDDRKSIGFT